MTLPQKLQITHGVLSLDIGGLERIVLNLIRQAVESGHQVQVICVERPGTLAEPIQQLGVKVISLDKPAGRINSFVDQAATVLNDLQSNILHTHQIGAAWYLAQAGKRLQIPVLHTEHGNHFARQTRWLDIIKARLFFRQTACWIDRFCCVAPDIARAVTRWRTIPKTKVEVIPNGIETKLRSDLTPAQQIRSKLGISADALVLGTVGRLVEVKRQDLLLRAFAEIRKAFPICHLVLVGDGPERSALESLSKELQLSEFVHFVGFQSRPEEYLQILDIFTLTSRSEGFPVSLLEAWVAGIPVVASAVGGIPNVLEDGRTGLLFPSGDVVQFVKQVTRLLQDRPLARQIGQTGQIQVRERYSLQRMAKEYESRYHRLIAAKQGAS